MQCAAMFYACWLMVSDCLNAWIVIDAWNLTLPEIVVSAVSTTVLSVNLRAYRLTFCLF